MTTETKKAWRRLRTGRVNSAGDLGHPASLGAP